MKTSFVFFRSGLLTLHDASNPNSCLIYLQERKAICELGSADLAILLKNPNKIYLGMSLGFQSQPLKVKGSKKKKKQSGQI